MASEEEAFEYSDDEQEDIEWEDVESAEEEETQDADGCDDDDGDENYEEPEHEEEEDEETKEDAPRHVSVDWDQVNAELNKSTSPKKKKKNVRRRMTKAEKERELELHKSHLLVLLSTQLQWNYVLCKASVVRGLLVSIMPQNALFDFIKKPSNSQQLKYYLQQLVQWFQSHFRINQEDGASAQVDANRLLQVFFDREGSNVELALLFTLLCRSLGFRTRHTAALDPFLLQQAGAHEAAFSQKRHKRQRRQKDIDYHRHMAPPHCYWIWSEVLDDHVTPPVWFHIDGVRKLIDQPLEISTLREKRAPLTYVISVEEDGQLMDTTARYVQRWSSILKSRRADKWMDQVIKRMNQTLGTTEQHDGEKRMLRQKIESEAMPTSIEGFRKHHLYCLDRHLGQYECVHPRKPVGLFKGQPVFLRKHVQLLRTAWKWRRMGREVRFDQLDSPVKRLLSKNEKAKQAESDDDDNEDQENASESSTGRALYGEWQTTPFVPEPVVDGRIPKNKYGNIEIWSDAHVPTDAVHLCLPRIATVAEQLGIDYAPAVIGFEVKSGKSYPKVDGIVVLRMHLETLVDAHAHVQQKTIEKAIQKNQSIIYKHWERLVKRALVRIRLNEDYGHVN